MSSDRYKCARCHYFFHELDMTKGDDGRLMCGDCAAIEYAGLAQTKESMTRWICSQCKYESSWQFARCGSCGCHGTCMDKKLPPPPHEDGMGDKCQCVDCGNYHSFINTHETSTGKLICKKCLEKYKVAEPNYSLPKTSHKIPMPPVKPCREPDNSHYKHTSIDPLQYVEAMGDAEYRGACILNIVKYITRYPHKGTPLEDLAKAQDYLNRLIEHERTKP